MRLMLSAVALGALLSLGACNGDEEETGETAEDTDTGYEGMRVRAPSTGWRLPGDVSKTERNQ